MINDRLLVMKRKDVEQVIRLSKVTPLIKACVDAGVPLVSIPYLGYWDGHSGVDIPQDHPEFYTENAKVMFDDLLHAEQELEGAQPVLPAAVLRRVKKRVKGLRENYRLFLEITGVDEVSAEAGSSCLARRRRYFENRSPAPSIPASSRP
jgi:hypothetical protein